MNIDVYLKDNPDLSVPELQEIYAQSTKEEITASFMIDGFEREKSWFMKQIYDKKGSVNKEAEWKMLMLLERKLHWVPTLQLLQVIPNVQMDRSFVEEFEHIIHPYTKSVNKYVQAAAFTAYHCIVKLIPELEREFIEQCEMVMETATPAVKVRLRRILESS